MGIRRPMPLRPQLPLPQHLHRRSLRAQRCVAASTARCTTMAMHFRHISSSECSRSIRWSSDYPNRHMAWRVFNASYFANCEPGGVWRTGSCPGLSFPLAALDSSSPTHRIPLGFVHMCPAALRHKLRRDGKCSPSRVAPTCLAPAYPSLRHLQDLHSVTFTQRNCPFKERSKHRNNESNGSEAVIRGRI